jgi:hypothetical protein
LGLLTGSLALTKNAVPLRVLNLLTDEAADHAQQEDVGARVRADVRGCVCAIETDRGFRATRAYLTAASLL